LEDSRGEPDAVRLGSGLRAGETMLLERSAAAPLEFEPGSNGGHVMSVLRRNNVKVSGRGTRPMLFARGFGCDQRMWRLVTPAFEDDYRIVLFDHVGSGQSDLHAYDRSKYGTLQGYADDVLEICAALDLTDVVFVGHSVSAMIGVLAALAEPERFASTGAGGPLPALRR
jgi:sigma-B regulation protein RsbQ